MPEDSILSDVRTYSILRTSFSDPAVNPKNPSDKHMDLFVSRYKRDGKLHLFASRLGSAQMYLSDRDVAVNSIDDDIGIVELPDGKKSRNELKPGDVLSIYLHNDRSGVPMKQIYEKTL